MSYYVNPHKFSCPWYPYAQEFGAPNINWCEETLCHWISEPANTWSNFAYLLVAMAIAFYSSRRQKDQDTELFAVLLFITGLVSGFYHASLNYFTQIIDFMAMYSLILWSITLNLKKMGKLSDGHKWYFFGGGVILLTIITHYLYLSFLPMQALVVITAFFFIFSEFKAKKFKDGHYKFFGAAVSLIVIGEIFSLLDLQQIACIPNNHIFQGHAIWHILSALGLGCLYLHFAQENPNLAEISRDSIEEDETDPVRLLPEEFISPEVEAEPEHQIEASIEEEESAEISVKDDKQLDLFGSDQDESKKD